MSQSTLDVFEALSDDLVGREAIGFAQHGKPLLANDGRDWLQEAYEEALDHAVYLKAALMSRALTPGPSPDAAGEGSPLPEWPSFGVKLACLSTFVAFAVLAIVGGIECLG